MSAQKEKVLILGWNWPEPNATAAGTRTMQLIRFFSDQGYALTFATAASKTVYSISLEDMGIDSVEIVLNDDGFDQFIGTLQPSMVVFDRFLTEEQFGWRVARELPGALRILDTQDLHSLRKSREEALKRGLDFTPEHWLVHETTLRELASIFRSDVSLLISEFEMQWLRDQTPIDPTLLYYFPFLFEKEAETPLSELPSFEERTDFVFIGNGKHSPNTDAIWFLKSAIWPIIREALPEAALHVYGPYLPQSTLQLHDPNSGFYVEGWVSDATKMMKEARLNLLPLRFGAGIKGKYFLGLECGTPSVCTEIGIEGTRRQMNPLNVGKDATSFAQKAIALYRDKTLWEQTQKDDLDHLHRFFLREGAEAPFAEKLHNLRQNLSDHRRKNITGAMLMHHTLASTKYLSRWINAKNELNSKIKEAASISSGIANRKENGYL
jgi:hypothetical protein